MSEKQKLFMSQCGQTVTVVNFPQIELYKELVREELIRELFPAIENWKLDPGNKDHIREVLDGAGDTLVVICGILFSMGVNPEEVKDRIDISNLTKIPKDKTQVKRREDGKILKPDTFKKPDLENLVDKVWFDIAGE